MSAVEQVDVGRTNNHDVMRDLERTCAEALDRCRQLGAEHCEVSVSTRTGMEVGVRNGEVETLARKRDNELVVQVYFGHCTASASTADLGQTSLDITLRKACAIARQTQPDLCNGLPDPSHYATEFPDLELWHPWSLTPREATSLACEMECGARDLDARITDAGVATVSTGTSLVVQASSRGFFGFQRGSRHRYSCSQIAADADGMQRGDWYSNARSPEDLQTPTQVGRVAAERALARLGARGLETRRCPVLFNPEMSKALLASFVSAVEGEALYRGASFLAGRLGTQVFPSFVQINEHPHLIRGPASASYDAEGVATRESPLIRDGVLQRYVLDSYAARRLGLQSTGNAGGVRNLQATGQGSDLQRLMQTMGSGLLVVEMMGQGASLITGDYSRGASGFWVENGAIAYPVEGITIAGNLGEMFANLLALGGDQDRRSNLMTGSMLVEEMTVAGS